MQIENIAWNINEDACQVKNYLTEPPRPDPSIVFAPHLCSFSLTSFYKIDKYTIHDKKHNIQISWWLPIIVPNLYW